MEDESKPALDEPTEVTTAPELPTSEPASNEPETTEPTDSEVASDEAVDEPALATAPVVPTPKRSSKRKRLALVVILILLLVGVAAAAFYFGRQTKTVSTPAAVTKTTAAAAKPVATTGASFLQTAEPVTPSAPLFKPTSPSYKSCYQDGMPDPVACDLKTYKLGTTKDGQTILAVDSGQQGVDRRIYVVLQSGSSYTILGAYSNITAQYAKSYDADLAPSVTIDTSTTIDGFSFDPSVTFKGAKFIYSTQYANPGYPLFNGLTDIRGYYFGSVTSDKINKLGTIGNKDLYQITVQQGDGFKVQELYATVHQVFAHGYTLSTPISSIDNTTPASITWADGTSNKSQFMSNPPGCGSSSGYLVGTDIMQSDLTKAGTTSDGQSVYELPVTAPLFQTIYKDDYGTGENLAKDAFKNLTAEQFQAKHGVVVAKNSLGEQVLYLNIDLIQGGGCGKPVVYLYPTKTQAVDVAVGANVEQSVPQYGSHGWRNVLAQPNGQLSYQGQDYPNLFWEGIGLGNYPFIDKGTVVPSSQAVATIRGQLMQQGLKASEIRDFLEYWQSRLPHTAYTRLTWFTTAQLNELAPLYISPKPTTIIRTFLDFQGVNAPYALKAQHFTAPARTGFTVVEWGGLNRSTGESH